MNEINPDFEIEPELLGACPRRVVPTKMTLFMRRLGWNGGLAILCLICFLASRDISDIRRLIMRGRVINGFITSAVRTTNDSDDSSCIVFYRSNRAAGRAEGSFYLHNSSRTVPKEGEPFVVTYLPDDSSVYRVGTVASELVGERRTYWIRIAFVWMMPYLLVVWMITGYYAQRKSLLQDGLAETATVVGRKLVKTDDGSSHILTYTFHLSDRKQRTGEARVTKALYDAYPVGRKFSILVDRADRRNCEPYFNFSSYQIQDAPKRSFL